MEDFIQESMSHAKNFRHECSLLADLGFVYTPARRQGSIAKCELAGQQYLEHAHPDQEIVRSSILGTNTSGTNRSN